MDISDAPSADAISSPNPVVDDTPAWEMAKENAQPLRRGRNAKALGQRLEAGPMGVSTDETERAAFEARLRSEANGEDPLATWCEYIRWQQETNVTGGELLPLVERCAHTFKDDARYTDDARYLTVWLAYTDLVRDAEPIFEYLNDRYIGITATAFWEAWAAALEAKGKTEAADKCFTNGLLMKAQPAGRLQRAHRDFQGRLMKKIMKSAQDAAAAPPPADREAKARKTLNRLTTKEASGTHRPTTQRAAAPIKRQEPKPPAPDENGNFLIFDESAASAPAASSSSSAPAAGADRTSARQPWETGTQTENAKENTGTATTWTQPLAPPAKKKVPARPVVPPPVDFEIHMDDELASANDDDSCGQPAAAAGADAVAPMRLQLAGPSLLVSKEIEGLQTNPLARFVEAPPSPPTPPPKPKPLVKKGLGGGGAPAKGLGGGGGGFAIFCDENAAPN